jgi:hypothetical protein
VALTGKSKYRTKKDISKLILAILFGTYILSAKMNEQSKNSKGLVFSGLQDLVALVNQQLLELLNRNYLNLVTILTY